MPRFRFSQTFPRPLPEVFLFFRRPANLVLVSPPELHMRLESGPELLELGSRITVRGRRWGVPQTIESEVTAFQTEEYFTDVQVRGPFRKFEHTHRFESLPGGTRVLDLLDVEPPGGLLGLVVTTTMIEKDLAWVFDFRRRKLEDLLGIMMDPQNREPQG